ncbi:MAG TPA: HAMP domain-containing histidine kinase [Caldithrix abyssi]|uniref:histidine kinase n=1 Tax=Caldithrix abyssi TaxID=187145 RepID=A0A7V5RPE6_CALAY|nr:HAMP domain-containing histidine kinase [Caldithrix abyssi]
MFKLLKRLSLKNQFVLIALVFMLVVDGLILYIYPGMVEKEEIHEEKQRIEKQISFINRIISNASFDDENDFIITLLNYIENIPDIEYVYTRYNFNRYIWPDDKFTMEQIESLGVNRIHRIQEKPLLALAIMINNENRIGKITLYVGVDGSGVVNSRLFARRFVYILILISLTGLLLLAFFFDRIVSSPLRLLINWIHFISIGQEKIKDARKISPEFKEAYDYLDVIISNLVASRKKLTHLPADIEKSKKRYEKIRKDLDKELNSLSNLVVYLLDLRRETSATSIFKDLVLELTNRQGHELCIVFTNDGEKLHYEASAIKTYMVLTNRLQKALESYSISRDHIFYKNLKDAMPVITASVPFQEELTRLNIEGSFGIIPVSTKQRLYGVIVVGTLEKTGRLEHKDLEKLMLLANMVALHLENIEMVSSLERMIRQRTSELQTTNNLLSDSIKQRDEIIKIISHDLNAPMRNVLGLIDSILRKYKTTINDDLNERINRIRNNVEKEMAMIQTVIDDLKSRELRETYREIDMNEMFSLLLEELSYELEVKNVRVQLQRDMPVLFSNQTIIKHVFINLIDNACKYMPDREQGNKIIISGEQKEGYITYKVEDNGIGIPQDKQALVFESYTQLSVDSGKGKGLGLALIRNMLVRLNGEIHLTSKVGKGSTFFVRFKEESQRENDGRLQAELKNTDH